MRLLFTTAAVCLAQCLLAQAPFQGKVLYNLQSPTEKTDAQLTAYFSPQGIRLEFAEKGKAPSGDVTVAFLDSGFVLNLNYRAKTFDRKPLLTRDASAYKPRTILGHVAQPKLLPGILDKGVAEIMGRSVFYTAADMPYPLPEKYTGNPELLVVNNGQVVLGAEIVLSSPTYREEMTAADSMEMNRNRITAEAVEIVPMRPPDSLFAIPAGFVSLQSVVVAADSMAMGQTLVDSVAVPFSVPKKKKTSPKSKKNSIQKTPANRRKPQSF